MKFFSEGIDWDSLRPVLLLNGVALLIVVLVAGGALYYRQQMLAERAAGEAEAAMQAARYQEIVEAERIIDTLYEHYKTLKRTGFIGREPRLRWLDTVRREGERSGILNLYYRLGEQREATAVPVDGDYRLYRSVMELQMALLHEGQLLDFLGGLQRSGVGLFQVENCKLQRLGKELHSDSANLSALCRLVWFTARPAVQEAQVGET